MPKFNDLKLEYWRESEILTDSLWIIPSRDNTGKHSGFYHGNFIPQIPNQLILRYSKKDDIIFDPFLGSGTTAFEAESLKRNFIGIDIKEELVNQVKSKLDSLDNSYLIAGDSTKSEVFDQVKTELKKQNKESVQLAILHPPYADIVKFSDLEGDLSNCKSLKEFCAKFAMVLGNTISILQKNRYLAIVIGDKYHKGQWIPLGFHCMNEAQKLGLTLKSIVVKNMEGNRADSLNLGTINWLFSQGAFDEFVQRINSEKETGLVKDEKVKTAAVKYRRIKEINTVRNDFIETLIFEKNQNILPTLNHRRGVDFFINGVSFDQKVAKSPTGEFKKHYKENWREIAISKPELVAEYLYKYQDEGRFGADPRVLVVYIDEDVLIARIRQIINETDLNNPIEINFSYKHKNQGEKNYKVPCFVVLLGN